MNELRRRQLVGLARIELRRILFSGRAIPIYLLAAMPVGLALINLLYIALIGRAQGMATPGEITTMFAVVYQFILRGVVYLGCVWVFMNLFRGEVLDRSLHFYFLAPIRRDLLAAGKYVTGWVASSLVFVTSTLVAMALLFGMLGFSEASAYLLHGPGLAQALAYSGVTMLACLGYGAVFLLIGLFFRNPIIPAVIIFQWEALNPVLPSLLKKISVIFYLNSAVPVAPGQGPFALLADPVPVWLAVPGLLLFTAVTLAIAGWRVRRMEVSYAADS